MLAEMPEAGLPQEKGEVSGSVTRGLWWLQCRKLVLSQQIGEDWCSWVQMVGRCSCSLGRGGVTGLCGFHKLCL